MRFRQSVLCGAALATLTACGGGGDGTVPDIPNLPANVSPVFVSATSISIEENTTGTIYTAQATDADSDAIALSVTGGADAGSVSFEASTGALTLNVAPDFEMPGDSNGDNVYEVILQASDGRGGVTMISLQIAITDRVDTVELVRVGDGFSQPLGLQALPDGSGRVLVVEKTGRVRLLNPATGAIESVDFLDVSGSISTNGERGLLGLALSPDFAANGFVYVHLTNIAGDSEVRRFQVFSGTQDQVDPLTQDVILQYAQPESNHNAGWIGFDRNGFLIVPTGDGGGSGDPNNLAQNPQSLLGKVLRLDVSADDFPSDPLRDYAIPAGNTFADPANGMPEIFAVGLRNPFQSSFDPVSGDLLIGDVGEGAIEEVNRLAMDDSSRNFGWALREGTAFFKGPDAATLT
ncbi:MAG: PQQ-dependent sugar dehydrogenase, partial [Pseudomonadota bacterium]